MKAFRKVVDKRGNKRREEHSPGRYGLGRRYDDPVYPRPRNIPRGLALRAPYVRPHPRPQEDIEEK